MQHAGGNEPAGARFQAVGFREIEDAVIAVVPAVEAIDDVLLGGAGFQTHERVREVVADLVHLRREVVRLGLAFLSDEGRLLGVLMHVMRDRAHVVEELRVDGPLAVLVPDGIADDLALEFVDCISQQELLAASDDVGQTFIPVAIVVRRFGRRAEPAFIDAAPMHAEGVVVIRMQLEPTSRLQE